MASVANYYLLVLNGALIGFMLFFVIVVSPVIFKTLSQEDAARFLRYFPKIIFSWPLYVVGNGRTFFGW